MNTGSNETFFGVTNVRVSADMARALDRIAQRHGATFVGPVTIPGNALRGWFAGPNRGEPFDGQLAAAVMADVAREVPGNPWEVGEKVARGKTAKRTVRS